MRPKPKTRPNFQYNRTICLWARGKRILQLIHFRRISFRQFVAGTFPEIFRHFFYLIFFAPNTMFDPRNSKRRSSEINSAYLPPPFSEKDFPLFPKAWKEEGLPTATADKIIFHATLPLPPQPSLSLCDVLFFNFILVRFVFCFIIIIRCKVCFLSVVFTTTRFFVHLSEMMRDSSFRFSNFSKRL